MGQNASRHRNDRKGAGALSADRTPSDAEPSGLSSDLAAFSGTSKPSPYQASSGLNSPNPASEFDITVSRGLLQLGIDLMRELRRSTAAADGNVVLSPYAVGSALQDLLEGARGDTAAQIEAALHLPPGHKELDPNICTDGTVIHSAVTAYFAERDRDLPNRRRSEPQQRFDMGYVNNVHYDNKLAAMDAHYRGVEEALRLERFSWDFASAANKACEEIDQHACLYTRAFEPGEIMPIGCIKPSSQVCLVSAVDFRGSWRYTFDELTATLETFHGFDGSVSGVVMIHQTGHFLMTTCSYLKATALQLPYQPPQSSISASEISTPADGGQTPATPTPHGSLFSLVILLPDDIDGLANVEKKLDATSAMRCFGQLKPVGTVRVSLPLFKVKQVVELGPSLSALGVRDVFTDRAELWGSTAGQKRVSSIRHAAAFETAQAGGRHSSRAKTPGQLGATLVQGLTSLVKVPHAQTHFVVDRPFLFFVICSNPDTLMLLGAVRKINW